MLWGADGIAVADATTVQLTDETQFGQYFQGAVDGCQTDLRVVWVYLVVDRSWGEVTTGGSDGLYHCPSLSGKFVALPP